MKKKKKKKLYALKLVYARKLVCIYPCPFFSRRIVECFISNYQYLFYKRERNIEGGERNKRDKIKGIF